MPSNPASSLSSCVYCLYMLGFFPLFNLYSACKILVFFFYLCLGMFFHLYFFFFLCFSMACIVLDAPKYIVRVIVLPYFFFFCTPIEVATKSSSMNIETRGLQNAWLHVVQPKGKRQCWRHFQLLCWCTICSILLSLLLSVFKANDPLHFIWDRLYWLHTLISFTRIGSVFTQL